MSPALPASERTPRSFWFDPRFAIGIGLVAVSVIGVLAIVATSNTSVQVLSAKTALSPGDRVDRSDLESRSVRLGTVEAKYLAQADVPASGFVATRAVSAGELVPRSALGTLAGVTVASIVVQISGELPQSVGAGSVVDLWSARQVDNNSFGPPSVLVPSATIVRVIRPEGIISNSGRQSVEILVPRTRTAALLEALANSDSLSLVPTGIPVKR